MSVELPVIPRLARLLCLLEKVQLPTDRLAKLCSQRHRPGAMANQRFELSFQDQGYIVRSQPHPAIMHFARLGWILPYPIAI